MKLIRRINGLLLKALVALLLFFLTDFTSGQLEAGFFSYALKYVAHIIYFAAGGFGGVWLALTLVMEFVPSYAVKQLPTDFDNLKPCYKLALLAFLIYAVFHLLNAFVSNV